MGTFLLIFISATYLCICAFLIVVVLMQEGKGGGLAGMITGGASPLSDTLGAYGAEQTLRTWTKWAAVSFMVLAIFITAFSPILMKPKSLATGINMPPPTVTETTSGAADDAVEAKPTPATDSVPAPSGATAPAGGTE